MGLHIWPGVRACLPHRKVQPHDMEEAEDPSQQKVFFNTTTIVRAEERSINTNKQGFSWVSQTTYGGRASLRMAAGFRVVPNNPVAQSCHE
jgi:hypothetical protein